jgi:hypothetical protein
MAAQDTHNGDQDITANRSTYTNFVSATKWSSLWLAATLVLLVVWFCTPGGLIPGAISAVVVLVAGYAFLRRKPAPVTVH